MTLNDTTPSNYRQPPAASYEDKLTPLGAVIRIAALLPVSN